MNSKSKAYGVILYVSLLAFISISVYILYLNQEVFYTAHDRSEFISGTPFFHTLMQKPFGLMQYVGAWMTQLFYYPALGSAVLAAIWILIFLVGVKAFQLQGRVSALMLLPVACLLTSVVDLGYWIYVSTIRGYWFSQSVGYLVMLLLLWAARQTPRKWHFVWYVLGFCLLFILCLILTEKPSWQEILGVVLLIFTASIWHTQFYSNLKSDDVMLAGLPHFITPSDQTPHLSYPFWALAIVSALIPLCSGYLAKAQTAVKVFVPILCAAAGIFFTWSQMYHDQNYIDEMRMVRYAEDDNWKEVLQMVEGNTKPTTTMVFLKNVALMNEGGLLDRSFKTGNIGYPIHNPDSIHVTFLNITSPLVYKELLERYTTLLHHLPFCGNWQPAPVTPKVKELQQSYPDEVTGVENSDSYIVNSVCQWNQSDHKVASEQALFYSMLRCDSHLFWPSLRKYLKMHDGEDFPLHAQEAYILFMDKTPEEKRMMIPVEETIFYRYKKFSEAMAKLVKPGKTIGQVAEQMSGEWGDTYWYYYFFGRQYSNIADRKDHEVQS